MSAHARRPLVSLVVPFHDEAETIDAFFAATLPILESVDTIRFEIVCVNDGSRDDTLDRLIDVAAGDPRVRIVDLTRRFGKEAALTAGIDEENHIAHLPSFFSRHFAWFTYLNRHNHCCGA